MLLGGQNSPDNCSYWAAVWLISHAVPSGEGQVEMGPSVFTEARGGDACPQGQPPRRQAKSQASVCQPELGYLKFN